MPSGWTPMNLIVVLLRYPFDSNFGKNTKNPRPCFAQISRQRKWACQFFSSRKKAVLSWNEIYLKTTGQGTMNVWRSGYSDAASLSFMIFSMEKRWPITSISSFQSTVSHGWLGWATITFSTPVKTQTTSFTPKSSSSLVLVM